MEQPDFEEMIKDYFMVKGLDTIEVDVSSAIEMLTHCWNNAVDACVESAEVKYSIIHGVHIVDLKTIYKNKIK